MGLTHEVFADQNDFDACIAQTFHVLRGFDARFADEDCWIFDQVEHAKGMGQIDFHTGKEKTAAYGPSSCALALSGTMAATSRRPT